MKDDERTALRAARAQTAVMRTLATEVRREGRAEEDREGLRTQAVEESARLVSAVEGLARVHRTASVRRDDRGDEAASTSPRRWPRVLVVEDDDATRDGIVRGLAPEYEVVAASNGLEGLKAASEASFDAIVVDMWMPGMDGVTMVDGIRRLPGPPVLAVVFLTAETAPERVVAGFAVGATSYLVKPVDLDLLEQELRWALAAPTAD
jgi:CheY-like chemotaxis protein